MKTAAVADPRPDPLVALERKLQMTVAILVVLGTSLLAIGQQNLIYAIVAVTAATASYILTDIKRIFELSPDATTLAALLACVVLVVQVIRNVEQSQLLNVANILIYLEVILLFQRKHDRSYWSLMALSLLQVIVAAALNLGLSFGLLLALYVLTSFIALTFFYALRESRSFMAGTPIEGSRRREVRDDGEEDAATEHYAFVGVLPREQAGAMLNRSLVKRLTRMVIVTAIGTVIVFFAIPRFNSAAWQGNQQNQVATVGFTEEVRLDDITRILESPEQVMRVEFTDMQGLRPYKVDGEPFFRGTVLSDYRNGTWKAQRRSQADTDLSDLGSYDLASTVYQRITLQPGSHSVLFNVSPAYNVSETSRNLRVNLFTRQITLSDDSAKERGPFRYTLGTSAFRNGWQRDIFPALYAPIPNDDAFYEASVQASTALQRSHPTLVATAADVLANKGLVGSSAFNKAKALEDHFRRSGVYSYSLEINRNRNRNLDAIEDFVQNSRRGHCEYFAGALTLMLRSQGIPARMVVGFKGGELNTVGNYYIVRQLHAHAWVEAYLPTDQIPEEEVESLEEFTFGAWLRLDPTPGAVDVTLDGDRFAFVTTAREVMDYCQVLWDDYVLGLNSTRQQQAIYQPIARSFRSIGRALFSRNAWSARAEAIQSLWQRLLHYRLLGIPGLAIFGTLLLGGALVLYVFRNAIGKGIRLVTARFPGRSRRTASVTPHLDLYDQLERTLRAFGLDRRPGQTPLEFARRAQRQIECIASVRQWKDLPLEITDAFYRVRYAGDLIQAPEKRVLSDALRAFENALANPHVTVAKQD